MRRMAFVTALVLTLPTLAGAQNVICRQVGSVLRCERDWISDGIDESLRQLREPRPTPLDAFWRAYDRQRLLDAEIERLHQESELLRLHRERLEREERQQNRSLFYDSTR